MYRGRCVWLAYSQIKSIEMVNFMGFERCKAYFDESGILNIKGYNGSGKSAFLTGMAVALMNLYPNKQAGYITHGKEYFRIIVAFDDSVVIVRDKYKNGQSLYEMYKGKQLIYSTKVGNKLTKVSQVPEVIEKYLGLVHIGNGYLNYQVRRDPLWLVETKGSENYQDVHETLKAEEIAGANNLINSDSNELSAQITSMESRMNNYIMQLDNYSDVSQDLIVALSEKEVYVQSLLNRYDYIYSIGSTVEELSGVQEVPNIEGIETGKFSLITKLKETADRVTNLPKLPEVSQLEIGKLSLLSKLKSRLSEVSSMSDSCFNGDIDCVDIAKYPNLGKLQKLLKECEDTKKLISELDSAEKGFEEEKLAIIEDATSHGIKFVVCDNCGTLLEVGEDG